MELLRIIERCLKIYCFRMEQSKNLLAALEAILALKEQTSTVNTSSSLEPGPSVPSEPSTSVLSSPERKRPRETEEMTRVKKPRLEQSVRKSIQNTFASIPIRVAEDIDMNEFLNSVKDEIHRKISEELDERNALKFYINVKTQLSRTTADGEDRLPLHIFVRSSKSFYIALILKKRFTLPEKESKSSCQRMRGMVPDSNSTTY